MVKVKYIPQTGKQGLVGDYIWYKGKVYYLGLYCPETKMVTLVNRDTRESILVDDCKLLGVSDDVHYVFLPWSVDGIITEMFAPFDPMLPFTKPARGTAGSIGYDLYVAQDVVLPTSKIVDVKGHYDKRGDWVEDYKFTKFEPVAIRTNTRCNFPEGWGGFIKERSSIGKRGIFCTAGVIDNDYKGEMTIMMVNLGSETSFKVGDRVAQLVLIPYYKDESTSLLNNGERGAGGFGSTGA